MMREKLRARLLARGIEWDDEQINSFIDSQTSNNKSAARSKEGWDPLPHTDVVGPSRDQELMDPVEARWGRPQINYTPLPEQRNAAIDFLGNQVSAGVYIYRLQAGNMISTRKMILMK